MSPLREFRSLTTRFEDDILIEPLRRYYLLFEGYNTERKYFQGIENNRKEFGINSQIELVILHKEGDISSFSHPIRLIELIEDKKKSLKRDGKFNKTIDRLSLYLIEIAIKKRSITLNSWKIQVLRIFWW